MKRIIGNCILGLVTGFMIVCLAFDVGPALAQAVQTLPAAGPGGGIDFGPLATNAITAAVLVLTTAGTILTRFAVRFLASKVHMQDSAAEKLAADRVNDILYRSIDYAEAWSKSQVGDPSSQIRHVKIDNFFVAQAVQFAMASMPDLIKMFGLTKEKIEAMVLARANAIMKTPEINQGPPLTVANIANPDPLKTVEGIREVKDAAERIDAAKELMGAPKSTT